MLFTLTRPHRRCGERLQARKCKSQHKSVPQPVTVSASVIIARNLIGDTLSTPVCRHSIK
jgi:hypothetical protein